MLGRESFSTQYLVLFDNPINRQQVAILARIIYPFSRTAFMRKFEDVTARPYGCLIVDLKAGTFEQVRLQTDLFDSVDQQAPDEENMSDDEDTNSVKSLDYICSISPPGKSRKLRDVSYKQDIWNRRVESLDYTSDFSPPSK